MNHMCHPTHPLLSLRQLCWLSVCCFLLLGANTSVLAQAPAAVAPQLPAADDFSRDALLRYQGQLLAQYPEQREMPLDLKAEHLNWLLEKYHASGYGLYHCGVNLPGQAGQPIAPGTDSDNSTWNGTLLATLSYKYAVTRDPATLKQICQCVRGLHLYQEVTEVPGLLCRMTHQRDTPLGPMTKSYRAPDGKQYFYHSSPAKGTYNQVSMGYATLWMTAFPDLPPDVQALARADATALAVHIVSHDYKATEKDGKPTPYGDLTPLIAHTGVPFNAQVCYGLVAMARAYGEPAHAPTLNYYFDRLRHKHHVYYENPARHLIQPQTIGGSLFLKGMNDRNHVTNAAYYGLWLEMDDARRSQRPLDANLMYQLGQTMVHSMNYLEGQRNAVCNFMWCGLLNHQDAYQAIIKKPDDKLNRQLLRVLNDGIEQLRRYPIYRITRQGEEGEAKEVQWCDAYRPDGYHWKCDPRKFWKVTGDFQHHSAAPIDFLHAYWLMRFYQLERHPAVFPVHHAILGVTRKE